MKFIKTFEYYQNKKNQIQSDFFDMFKNDISKAEDFVNRIAKQFGYTSAKYLDSGSIGMAFQTSDPNKIIKLTWDESEVANAFKLKKKNTYRIINYYDVAKIEYINSVESDKLRGNIYAIICDKIEPLRLMEKEILQSITRGQHITSHNIHRIGYDTVLKYVSNNQKTILSYIQSSKAYLDSAKFCVDEYFKMIKECDKIGIRYGDAHYENIGFGEFGQLVFFDVGVYSNYDDILHKVKVVRV